MPKNAYRRNPFYLCTQKIAKKQKKFCANKGA